MHRFLFFLIFLFFSCSENVQDHLEKATKAMQKEEGRLALEHYQKAYLLALDDKLFPLGKDLNFQKMATDLTGEYIGVTSQEKKETLFWLLNTDGKILKKEKIKADVKELVFSPAGAYIVFSTQPFSKTKQKQNKDLFCDLFLFDSKTQKTEKIPERHRCDNLPAVSDRGIVYWLADTTLKSYNSQKPNQLSSVSLKIKYSIDSIEPKASLFYTLSQNLFLTYGQAGIYNLYRIENNNTTLVSSKTAFWRLLFIPNSSKIVRVEGGAGKRHLLIFDGAGYYHARNEKRIAIDSGTDFAFANENQFYFIEKNSVKENGKNESNPLPFLALALSTDKYGEIYLLTSDNKFVKYTKETPSEQTLEIFKKVQEFYN